MSIGNIAKRLGKTKKNKKNKILKQNDLELSVSKSFCFKILFFLVFLVLPSLLAMFPIDILVFLVFVWFFWFYLVFSRFWTLQSKIPLWRAVNGTPLRISSHFGSSYPSSDCQTPLNPMARNEVAYLHKLAGVAKDLKKQLPRGWKPCFGGMVCSVVWVGIPFCGGGG
jgi:hypothetical protein